MKPFDADGAYAPEIPQHGARLRRLAIQGAGTTVLSGIAVVSIQIVATVTLARLLSAHEIGLVVMVTTFSLMVMNCGYCGITDAVVQCERIDHALASSLFWINLGVGLLLTLAFCAAGPWLARLCHEPILMPIAAALSLTILLNSAPTLHLALLKRAMLFRAVAANDIISRAISVTVSVYGAWRGWGAWAIVAGSCAQMASAAIGAFWLCRWRPMRFRLAPGTWPMLRFSIQVYGRYCIYYVTRNTDNLLVGTFLGTSVLGFYKRAFDLFALSASQISTAIYPVAISSLSRLRSDPFLYRRALLRAISWMAMLGMGLSGLLALIGPDLIRILLGPGWQETGLIFVYFAPGIGIMLLSNINNWIHPSIGRADRWLVWGIAECLITCTLFLAGLHWGAKGVAMAWTLSYWLLAAPALWFAGRPINLKLGTICKVTWRYILAALVAALAASWLVSLLAIASSSDTAQHAAERLAIRTLSFVAIDLIAITVLFGSFDPLREIGRLLRDLVARSQKQAAI